MTITAVDHPPGLLNRLRHSTLLRILIYAVAIIGPVVGFEWGTHFFVPEAPSPWHTPIRMAANLVGPLLALLIYPRLVRRFEGRRATELDIGAGALSGLAGLLLGAALIAASFGILWGLGVARFEAGEGVDTVLTGLIMFFCVAVFEEMLMRAIVFRLLEQVWGTTVAIAISSALFGLAHMFNPDATVVSTVQIALEAGVLLALAYAVTRNLWFAIGIHMGWNYAQGNIFGGFVSGTDVPHSLLKTTLTGPDYLTGGAFGLEASVVALIVCLAASVVLGVMVVRRGEWRPRRSRLEAPGAR